MISKIIVKKTVKCGVKGFVFVRFLNIFYLEQLPNAYVEAREVCFYKVLENVISVWPGTEEYEYKHYQVGDFITKEDFDKLIKVLKQAGQRLTNINKKFKNNWVDGKEITIKI